MEAHHSGHEHMMDMSTEASGGGHSGGNMGGMVMMQMWFTFSTEATLLFDFWKTTTPLGLFASCVGVFVLAALFEALKAFREGLYLRQSQSGSSSSLLDNERPSFLKSIIAPNHLIQSVLYTLQVTLGYFVMLLVMSFNAWIFIAIILGAAVGFVLFGWNKGRILDVANDHCG